MKRRILSIFLTLVLVCSFSLVTAVPVAAQDGVPDRITAITTTANRLVALQSSTDYGWDWKVTGLTAHSGSDSAYNMYGVVILGLLDAYGETGTASYLDAATGMANHMTSGTASNGDFYKQGGLQERAGSYDYQFLMRYAVVSGDSAYSDYAETLWAWENLDLESLWAALLAWAGDDPGAALWMLASYAEAGRLIGDDPFATGCAVLIVDNLGSLAGDYMTLAECLEFLSELDSVAYSSTIDSITSDLVDAQQADGCWDDGFAGTFQDTVYAVRALAVYGGTDGLDTARKGAAWLIANQLPNGGWIDDSGGSSEEFSEQDAEGLRALVATEAPVTIGDEGYYSIQQAIDSADLNDTISVAAGTYLEDVTIDKQLTLQGAGSASTIIDASGASADYGILLTAGGTSASQRLTIKGLTIKNSPSHGIKAYKGVGLSLDYVTFEDLVLTLNGVRGMEIHNEASVHDMEITRCEFVSNDGQGLRTASNVIVDGLVITDSKFNGNSYGIYLQGTINGVTLLRSEVNDNTEYGAYMTETGPLTNLVIEDSEFKNNDAGLMVWNEQDNVGITITRALFQDNAKWGVIIWGNSLTDVLIEDSTVLNNDGLGEGYYGIDFCTYDEAAMTNVAVHFTSITGHTLGGGVKNRNTEVTAIVDATMNWWGDVAGPEITTNPYDAHNAGADNVTTNVDYIPWLIHTELASGWNVYSTPIAPDTATDTIGKALDLWTVESGNLGLSYYYGYDSVAEKQAWISANADTALTPLQAVYLNMTEAATIDVVFSTDYSEIPSKTMYADWNLIGLAELYDMGAEGALASAYYVAGANNIGYSQVVSPGLGQTAWNATRRADIDTVIGQDMTPCEGYWLLMVNEGTLGGFTSTPIAEVLP